MFVATLRWLVLAAHMYPWTHVGEWIFIFFEMSFAHIVPKSTTSIHTVCKSFKSATHMSQICHERAMNCLPKTACFLSTRIPKITRKDNLNCSEALARKTYLLVCIMTAKGTF